MYRLLEDTADQYMTRPVTTVTRETTMRELEALFEKHDFFRRSEHGKMLGIVTKFDFLRAFAFTTGQMVPHYDELMRRPIAEMETEAVVSRRTGSATDSGSPVDGGPEEPQFSGHRVRSRIGRNDLSRGRDTRTQRGDTGQLNTWGSSSEPWSVSQHRASIDLPSFLRR
jgi:CBS domain-containing protein